MMHRIPAPQLCSCSCITGPAAEDVLPVRAVLSVLEFVVGHQVVCLFYIYEATHPLFEKIEEHLEEMIA